MNNGTEQIFLLNSPPSQSSASTQRMGAIAPPPSTQVNLDNVQDFSHVCRTCATITELVMPIFSGEGLQNKLADKIKKHLPIKVREADTLPLVVCYPCANTLLAWHELVKCCVQADAALRAKLASNQQKTNPPNNVTVKSSANVEDEPRGKNIPSCTAARPQPYRACVYCGDSLPVAKYREHLAVNHSTLLFHCEGCDNYIDRKDLIMHMSFHALQYTSGESAIRMKYKKKKAQNNNQAPTPAPTTTAPKCSPKIDSQSTTPNIKTEEINTPVTVKIDTPVPVKRNSPVKISKTSVQDNEFSDHSDTEGFGPLPESVFEAIEDSQDGQQLTQTADSTSDAPDSERVEHEPDECVATQNNNLTNPNICLENNNNMNNCSVVIEPMKIEKCAQLNTVNKNRSVTNILIPPINKTPPKTAEVSNKQSTNDKRNKNQNKIRNCPYCPKQYRASSSYFYHLKNSHEGSKEHECDVCGKKLGTKSSLKQHMAIHNAFYDYECSQCEKQFKSKAGLYIHEQTHKGTKLFSCNHCDASFRWKTHLARHMSRHAAARAHVCAACGRAFSVRADLQRHARTHTRGDHSCAHCGDKFAQLRYLKVHTQKQHARHSRRLSK